jgi:hypothetical protein
VRAIFPQLSQQEKTIFLKLGLMKFWSNELIPKRNTKTEHQKKKIIFEGLGRKKKRIRFIKNTEATVV